VASSADSQRAFAGAIWLVAELDQGEESKSSGDGAE